MLDKSRPNLVPDVFLSEDDAAREEWVAGLNRDIYINLLAGVDDGELGEMIRTTLVEPETCYDSEQGELVPGYHDPADEDEARPGEQRAYVVISGS